MRKPMRRPMFEDACRTVARVLSEDGGKPVRVVFAGTGASTNGDTIFLPAGDQMAVMQPEDCGVLAGYVDHEAEHRFSTDMDLWNSTIGRSDDYRREMANAMEDMRIEKISVRRNPGSFANLSDTTKNVCTEELKALTELKELHPEKLASKRFILPGAVTWEGRKRAGMHSDLQQQLLDLLPAELQEEAKRINDAIAKMRDGRIGTHDVWELAKKYGDDLEAEELELPPMEPEDQGDEKGKGDRESDENEESTSQSDDDDASEEDEPSKKRKGKGKDGDEKDTDETSEDGTSEDDQAKNNKEDGEQENDSNGNNDDGNGDEDDNDGDDDAKGGDDGDDTEDDGEDERSGSEDGGKEKVKQLEQVTNGNGGGGRGASLNQSTREPGETRKVSFVPVIETSFDPSDQWIPFTTENDIVVTAQSEPIMVWHAKNDGPYTFDIQQRVFDPSNIAIYERHKELLGPHVNTMRAKLRRALMSKMERRWDGGYTSGRIDPRRLVDAVRGTPEVFRRRDPETYIDTAVQIMIDLSGSMISDGRIGLATTTAIALANALEGTGVAYEIIGFQETGNFATSPESAEALLSALNERFKPGYTATFSRYLQNMIVEFKPFNRTLRECRVGLGGIRRAVGGANNDLDALLVAHRRLIARDETRKIMIVLSDGKPATLSDFDPNYVEHMFRKLVAQFEKEALIQIVGIGIESDCVRKFYKHYSVLNSAEELPRTVIDQVARMLLGGRYQIDNAKLLGAA